MCLHTYSSHKCCRVAAQKLPNITARLRHNSPNIGKYIPTCSRDNAGNGTFYCNNTSLMADMVTERANGIWAGVSNLSKRVHWICSMSAGGSVDLFMPLVNQDCGNLTHLYDKARTTDYRPNLYEVLICRESASQAGWSADKMSIKRQFSRWLSDVVKTQASFTLPATFPIVARTFLFPAKKLRSLESIVNILSLESSSVFIFWITTIHPKP